MRIELALKVMLSTLASGHQILTRFCCCNFALLLLSVAFLLLDWLSSPSHALVHAVVCHVLCANPRLFIPE